MNAFDNQRGLARRIGADAVRDEARDGIGTTSTGFAQRASLSSRLLRRENHRDASQHEQRARCRRNFRGPATGTDQSARRTSSPKHGGTMMARALP